ncbi:MAG: hypothetical protein K9H49_17750 [Bacteroidales bacterium]|nr:hypothetical protein [Bacteroidales bacterium]MCF8391459.1 hypothetical protein [Bacteroidales bacterium]
MKKYFIVALLFLFSLSAYSQIEKAAGGLLFSSGVDFNTTTTGNPGFFGKAYLEVVKRLYFVPTVGIYIPGEGGDQFSGTVRKNYMFQGDLDFQYGIMKEDKLKLFGFAGLNTTGIISRVDEASTLENSSALKPGLNIGAAIEMTVDNAYEALISGKYIAGEFNQFVISIGVIYRFDQRGRRGW